MLILGKSVNFPRFAIPHIKKNIQQFSKKIYKL